MIEKINKLREIEKKKQHAQGKKNAPCILVCNIQREYKIKLRWPHLSCHELLCFFLEPFRKRSLNANIMTATQIWSKLQLCILDILQIPLLTLTLIWVGGNFTPTVRFPSITQKR